VLGASERRLAAGRRLADEDLFRDRLDVRAVESVPRHRVIRRAAQLVTEADRHEPAGQREAGFLEDLSRQAASSSLSSRTGAPVTPCQKPPSSFTRLRRRNS
jgi:hypothetical protein